jgi:hypothetical protein
MFVRLSILVVRSPDVNVAVATLIGKIVSCKCVVCGCPVSICGRVLSANLVIFAMNNYDVIL